MKHWQKFLYLFVAFTVLVGMLGINALSVTSAPKNMQPVLVQIADESPEQMVSVIVQFFGDTRTFEGRVAAMGGKITRDLHIINAVTVELPAKAVSELAEEDGVRFVSLDGAVETTGRKKPKNPTPTPPPSDPTPTPPPDPTPTPLPGEGEGNSCAVNSYDQYFMETMNVEDVWNMGLKGDDLTIAVIDSGIQTVEDFDVKMNGNSGGSRVVETFTLSPNSTTTDDVYGHGTHIAGIAAGNGKKSNGQVSGIAPKSDLISLKISDEDGAAFESDVVLAMQWVLENKDAYNIRVVNLSIRAIQPQSYHTSPIDAAAEILWFNGLVVVASAGNEGPNAVDYAPANDPFVITVGASDECQTADPLDDFVADYSAYGVTMDGFAKPDIVAPGQDIVAPISDASLWSFNHPDRIALNGWYFRLSGTSMSAPMAAGAVLLLLEDEPDLTPDQVKYRLMHTGSSIEGVEGDANTYPYLNVLALVTGTTTESANTGTTASQLLWTGDEPVDWDSVNWNSVNWNSVNWNSVNWNSVNWNSVNWNSIAWDY